MYRTWNSCLTKRAFFIQKQFDHENVISLQETRINSTGDFYRKLISFTLSCPGPCIRYALLKLCLNCPTATYVKRHKAAWKNWPWAFFVVSRNTIWLHRIRKIFCPLLWFILFKNKNSLWRTQIFCSNIFATIFLQHEMTTRRKWFNFSQMLQAQI